MKRILTLLLTAALLLSLAGCHGSMGLRGFTVPETFDESKPVEITFWAKNDTNKYQTQIYEDAIASFEALYPNITVRLRLYTDYGKIYNDVITNIATGTTPNVCITYPDHIATYLTGTNVVVPLDELMQDERWGLGGSELRFESPAQDEIVPQFLSECRVGDHYCALPFMRSTEACYVNRTFVEALGYTLPDVLTWDFVWEVSEAAMAKNEDGTFALNGQNVLIPFIYKSTDNMMITLLRQEGAEYSTSAGEVRLFNDDTTGILRTVAEHAASGAFSTFSISGYPANFLNAGQCIFAVDSTAGSTWMGSDAPLCDISEDKLVSFELAVRPVPQTDPGHPQMISQGPSVCIFNKADSNEVMASWLFAQYLLSDSVQIAYSETEGYVPVTTSAQSTREYRDYLSRAGEDDSTHYRAKIEAVELLLAHTQDTFTAPVYNGSASLRSAAGQLIENVTKSVRRRETVDAEYIEELYADVSALYRLDQTGESVGTGREELGRLPALSAWLLAVLALTWLLLGAFAVRQWVKRSKKR